MLRHIFVGNDVGNHGAPAFFQDPENFLKQLPLRLRFDQIKDAIRDDHVDRVGRDERMLDPQFLGQLIGAQKRRGVSDRPRAQFGIELLEVEREILDAALAKLDVLVTDPLRHDRRIRPGHVQHLVRHVDPDHLSLRPDDLRRDETNLAGAAAEIEHGLAFSQIFARVAAAVIAIDDLLRNDFEIFGIVIDRATKLCFGGFGSGGVTFPDGGFGVDRAHVGEVASVGNRFEPVRGLSRPLNSIGVMRKRFSRISLRLAYWKGCLAARF